MAYIAKRTRSFAQSLVQRLSVSDKLARGGRRVGIMGNPMDADRPLVVGTGALPLASLGDVDGQRSSRLNLDDFIALTENRVLVSNNQQARTIMNQILQQRRALSALVDSQNLPEARATIQEIAREIARISDILNNNDTANQQAKQ